MSDKYDLAAMLEEIKEDELVAVKTKEEQVSQDDIRKLLESKRAAKASGDDKSG